MLYRDYFDVIDFSPLYKTLKSLHVFHNEIAEKTGKLRHHVQALFTGTRLTDTQFIFDTAKELQCNVSDIVEFKDIKPRYSLMSVPPKKDSKLSYKAFLANIEYWKGKPARELLEEVPSRDIDYKLGIRPEITEVKNRTLNYEMIKHILDNDSVSVTILYDICKHFNCYPDDVLA